MASDAVADKGGRIGAGYAGGALDKPAAFDEGLKAVADAQDKAVALQESVEGIGDFRMTQDGGDVFAGAVGFIAGGEASGDAEYLAFINLGGEVENGFMEVAGAAVKEEAFAGDGAVAEKGAFSIVFAVGAGEDGDADAG